MANIIYIVTETEFDYDSHHNVNVKAFRVRRDAEQLKDKLIAAQEHKAKIFPALRKKFLLEWCADNPEPHYEYPHVPMPKWDSRNGKKKNADPAILAAFVAEEERIRSLSQTGYEKHAERHNAWTERALEATLAMLVEGGFTAEEAEAIVGENKTIGSHLYPTTYDYEVEEVEFE